MNGVEEQGAIRARRRHQRGRVDAEEVVRLAKFLDGDERQLVIQVYRHGQPVSGLAVLSGVKPASLHRRLANIRKRMSGSDFRVVSECLDLFPVKYRVVAERRYLRGFSLDRIVRETGLTMHQVRQRLNASRALIKVAGALMTANAVSRLSGISEPQDGEEAVSHGMLNINKD